MIFIMHVLYAIINRYLIRYDAREKSVHVYVSYIFILIFNISKIFTILIYYLMLLFNVYIYR